MNRRSCLTLKIALSIGLMLCPQLTRSEETNEVSTDSTESDAKIALVPIGEIESTHMERWASHIESYTGCKAYIKAPSAILEQSSDAQCLSLKQLKKDNDRILVAIMNVSPENLASNGIYTAESIGFINIRTLKPESIGTEDGGEQFLRRVEKHSMYVTGRLLGLEVCPFFLCVMSVPLEDTSLDEKPRDYCPPCQSKLRVLLNKTSQSTETL